MCQRIINWEIIPSLLNFHSFKTYRPKLVYTDYPSGSLECDIGFFLYHYLNDFHIRAFFFFFFSHLNWKQETGWMPSHVVAKDENENVLGVVPLYLKRLASSALFARQIFGGESFSCFQFDLQPLLWWVCFRSWLGGCLLQLWVKILSEVPMLCTFHSSNWTKNFGP